MKKKIIGAVLAALMLGGAVTVSALESQSTPIYNVQQKVVLTAENDYTLDLELYLYGDVDCKNQVNSTDAMLISKSLLPTTNKFYAALDEYGTLAADVDGNGVVNSTDAMLISKSLLPEDHKFYAPLYD